MIKEELKSKLKDLGIITDNCYPKTSFIWNGQPSVGLYEREIKDKFYFHNAYDGKIYSFIDNGSPLSIDTKTNKFIVPLSSCEMIWEDKPYEELPDEPYSNMTIRDFVCMHLRLPESNKPWLNELIRKAT